MEKGIIVAVDSHSEWLLDGWWQAYSTHNAFPVTFVDLGMSKKGVLWAKEKGNVIEPSFQKQGLLKPLILALSIYQETIWIELNCEVQGNLSCLFEELSLDQEMGLCLDRDMKGASRGSSSGVIVFKQVSKLLSLWIATSAQSLKEEKQFFSSHSKGFKELKAVYNWNPLWGANPEALIVRWPFKTGKLFIDKDPLTSKVRKES